MTRIRFAPVLNCILLASLLLASCGGAPTLPSFIAPTPTTESPTAIRQAYPPALIETDPPPDTVIGHLSPITFYFNQEMNKASVESALSGLPEGTFSWSDDATLVFTPAQPYTPNSKLNIVLANSIQAASGFGAAQPIQLSFIVADYLRATNLLPKANTTDVEVDAAIAVSFNQPVVPLGAEASSLPPAFNVTPALEGRSEWINTSTYVFYPEPAMLGGTEYTVSINANLKTETGVGLDPGVINAWKFVTSRPRVVSVSPSPDHPIPPNPEIKLTFNQPMDRQSAQLNFLLSGPEGSVNGAYTWNEDDTVLTFVPERPLSRGTGYTLNLGAGAKSKGGMILGDAYGTVLRTYGNFAVSSTEINYGSTSFTFTAPLAPNETENFVTITPNVENLDTVVDGVNLSLFGSFNPDTDYVIELSEQLSDQWGQSLGAPFVLNVRTPPMSPTLFIKQSAAPPVFVRPDNPMLYGNAMNVQEAELTVAPLSLQDFFTLQNSYDLQQTYAPTEPSVYPQTFNLPPNRLNEVTLRLAEENNQLPPALYYVSLASPQLQPEPRNVTFVVSSQVNLTFKLGATEALIWAVDLPSQAPVPGAPVTLYDEAGNILASGVTDSNGLWQGEIGGREGQVFAMLGAPGDSNFGWAVSRWNMGINAWDFGYSQRVQAPHTEIYMYTDRPIYRPGQTVYYRGIVRQAFNGRYELPSVNSVPIILNDGQGTQLASINAQLSPYGTFSGHFELSQDAVPGNYTFQNSVLEFYLPFQVAEYRKPEINLNTEFSSDEIKQGDPAQANVNARYFFDAPAGNIDVTWALYTKPGYFHIPNYRTGLIDTGWLEVFRSPAGFDSGYFGGFLNEGTAQTSAGGTLSISLTAIPKSESPQVLTLEVTAMDETGLPVSARSALTVHPADFYIGLHPDQWIGAAKTAIGFEVYTVDWERNPSGNQTLTAQFKQVRWEKETDENGYPAYTPVYTPVSSSNLVTGADGRARLSFIPPNPGTYMLDVSGAGARSQVLVWVGGEGSASWPDLPNQRIELTADRESYNAGDTAKIFIPNPFAANALALVTVERGVISKAEVVALEGSGAEYALPITDAEAPNVYVSVTVLGQGNDFRQGLINLPVAPEAQELKVQLFSNPSEAGPRDQVTFDVVVTDHNDQPVQGEFSLSVVDLATLALADSNAEDILPAYYSDQPLGIETGLSLAAYSGRNVLEPGGMGGGGSDEAPFVREDFPDTAYWNPSLITNAEGRSQVTMTLPDSLTTWQVDVRGVTMDTKVGQAETRIVSTKPLLIRPVTPRFLVSGDHVLMAAVVNNNTDNRLSVSVNIQSDGFVLDNPESATRNFEISPRAQARVEWWGTAALAETADLVFSVTTGGTPSLQDSARPVWGKLPILQYSAPQAFVTGGVLRGAASQQEVISLPRTFTPGEGTGLSVELSPSLAGSLLSALEAMEIPPYSISAEASLSYLLPNIEVHRALNNSGLSDPALSERVETNLNASVSRLQSLQNADGGWKWWGMGEKSDPYVSAYVLFGLSRAQAIGASVSKDTLARAIAYLQEAQTDITPNTTGAELDEAAFIQFVLSETGVADQVRAASLYDARDRMSPASRALLALVIYRINPADPRVRELVTTLEAGAIRSASSAHWETQPENIRQRGSPLYTTSIVLYILSQVDPANQIVLDAVRYLMAHRNARGLWNPGYENAWAAIALNEAMVGLGDLRSDFAFNAALNGNPLTSGDVNGIQLAPLKANVPLELLSPDSPNLLTIQREDGLGRLFYNIVLKVNRPVQDVKPLNAGMGIERTYCRSERSEAQTKTCTPLSALQLAPDKQITAQLTLTLPNDMYYVMVEDHIPGGMEVLNRDLKTSRRGSDSTGAQIQFKGEDPFADGWGWWLFNEPQIHDESILFTADYLPAGTYVLTYTLIPVQAGEYRVLPARAWQAFFPEVQGTSAGALFEIVP
ncbi:MAG: Ig-like domain-containing protein [Chloroflexi bacterium]|nr:Ig-like domain-containing protein [Chloroflexota bacterium]